EDGIRDRNVTGVQTCALPISQVKLLAHTVIESDVIAELMDIQPQSTDAETLVTFAGRSCYESWHRPKPETYRDEDYIARTIFEQIGRASCRERGWGERVGGAW